MNNICSSYVFLCFILCSGRSVMSDSLRLHGSQVLCPWNFPCKNTGVGRHKHTFIFYLDSIFYSFRSMSSTVSSEYAVGV